MLWSLSKATREFPVILKYFTTFCAYFENRLDNNLPQKTECC